MPSRTYSEVQHGVSKAERAMYILHAVCLVACKLTFLPFLVFVLRSLPFVFILEEFHLFYTFVFNLEEQSINGECGEVSCSCTCTALLQEVQSIHTYVCVSSLHHLTCLRPHCSPQHLSTSIYHPPAWPHSPLLSQPLP